MPSVRSPQSIMEYEELDSFLRFYLVAFKDVDIALIEKTSLEIEEKFGRSKALVGLRQAVNDIIEEFTHADEEVIRALNRALSAEGLVTFSELRRRYSAQYKRILKRGNIKNDTEFYIVSSIVSDLGAQVPDEERSKFQRMIEVYEQSI